MFRSSNTNFFSPRRLKANGADCFEVALRAPNSTTRGSTDNSQTQLANPTLCGTMEAIITMGSPRALLTETKHTKTCGTVNTLHDFYARRGSVHIC